MTKSSTDMKYMNDEVITCVLKNQLPLQEQLRQILLNLYFNF
jgi:hypothetical protein